MTNRILLVEHHDYFVHFSTPSFMSNGTRIPYFFNKRNLRFKWNLFKKRLTVEKVCDALDKIDMRRTRDLLGDVLEFWEGQAFDHCILDSIRHRHSAMQVFHAHDRFYVMRQTMSLFMSHPTSDMRAKIHEVKSILKWNPDHYHITVQYRAFVDYIPNHIIRMKVFSKFCEILERIVREKIQYGAFDPSKSQIYFTTDEQELHETARESLKSLNINILNNSIKPEHSSRMPTGSIKLPIVEWFLLGESDLMFSTGTTFGIFGAARGGYKTNLFLWKNNSMFYEEPDMSRVWE